MPTHHPAQRSPATQPARAPHHPPTRAKPCQNAPNHVNARSRPLANRTHPPFWQLSMAHPPSSLRLPLCLCVSAFVFPPPSPPLILRNEPISNSQPHPPQVLRTE